MRELLGQQFVGLGRALPRDVPGRIGGLVEAQSGEVVVAAGLHACATASLAHRRSRQRASRRTRIDEAVDFRLDVAPGPEQSERKSRLDHHAPERQAAAPLGANA